MISASVVADVMDIVEPIAKVVRFHFNGDIETLQAELIVDLANGKTYGARGRTYADAANAIVEQISAAPVIEKLSESDA